MSSLASDISASIVNGTVDDADISKRDIKNHLLFEVSTEAANRGMQLSENSPFLCSTAQLEESTP